MKKKKMEENYKFKKIKTLLEVVSVGIIGTALWELLLKNLLFYFGNFFAKSISIFYKGYLNELYSKVGDTGDFFIEMMPSIFIIIIIIFLPVFVILFFRKLFNKIERKSSNESKLGELEEKKYKFFNYLFDKKYRFYIFILIICLPNSILSTDLLLRSITTSASHNYINKNIIILKPYLTEKEHDIIRSNFRQINNKEKFIKLLHQLNVIAKKNQIKLEEVNFIGVGSSINL